MAVMMRREPGLTGQTKAESAAKVAAPSWLGAMTQVPLTEMQKRLGQVQQ